MRILHISDTHGGMPALPKDGYDVVVHSGDLMPNRTFGIRAVEEAFQPHWLETNAAKLRAWLGADKPFLFCPGNHDFVDPVPHLKAAGVRAFSLVDTLVAWDHVRFYGFPWTPEFCGWNWMCGPVEMGLRLEPGRALLDEGEIDVWVSHGPMYGVLDRTALVGERAGSKVVRAAMQMAKHPPRIFLHGHIHEAAGLQAWTRGMIVSNAACMQRILEIEPAARVAA
jgi:Icc-related predicted phosphoesterase